METLITEEITFELCKIMLLKANSDGMDLLYATNLVPRVLGLFSQQLVARRDSGELEFYLNFFIGCLVTACIVLPQKSHGNKIPVPKGLSW